MAELTTMLEQALEDNIITRNQLMALLPKYPKVSSFYLLPKVHKELNNPPGRPIVAGMGSLCEPICRMGRNDIEFLDVLFDVDENGLIRSDVYRKKTSTNSLLHASSSHPAKLIRSIPTGQFLRIRRICSTDSNFEKQAIDMKARFQERGYPMRTIEQGYQRAKRTKRMDLLTRKIKKSEKDDQGIAEKNQRACPRDRGRQE
ncbi:uncharacterized protein [Engystomops pustulosus]|uniref:uncharacterized protein n=1 Tax=Engystomops pustulosus TaxID=76066 RepID=UPI003AFAEE52